jgi:hypothetical protein
MASHDDLGQKERAFDLFSFQRARASGIWQYPVQRRTVRNDFKL